MAETEARGARRGRRRLGTLLALGVALALAGPAWGGDAGRWLSGRWRAVHAAGYRDYAFYPNGVFTRGGGAMLHLDTPTARGWVDVAHAAGGDVEAGHWRLRGHTLELVFAEDGSTERLEVARLSGTGKRPGDWIRLGRRARYQRQRGQLEAASLPQPLPGVEVTVRHGRRRFSPPFFACHRCLWSRSQGVRLRLTGYAGHDLRLELPTRVMEALFRHPRQPVRLVGLPGLVLSTNLRAGLFTRVLSGSLTILGGRKVGDTYHLSVHLEEVHLGLYDRASQPVKTIELDATVRDLALPLKP